MSVFLKAGALALGVAALAAPADAITIIEEPGSNLAAFSYTVDSDAKVITLRETWGPATATEVLLKFVDWPHGLDGWRVDKFVTNQTGDSLSVVDLAVIVSKRSATASVLNSLLNGFSGSIRAAVSPIT